MPDILQNAGIKTNKILVTSATGRIGKPDPPSTHGQTDSTAIKSILFVRYPETSWEVSAA